MCAGLLSHRRVSEMCAGVLGLSHRRLPGLNWGRRCIFCGLEWCPRFREFSSVLCIWDFNCLWKILYNSSHFKYLSHSHVNDSQLLWKRYNLYYKRINKTEKHFTKIHPTVNSFFVPSHLQVCTSIAAPRFPCLVHLWTYSSHDFLHICHLFWCLFT